MYQDVWDSNRESYLNMFAYTMSQPTLTIRGQKCKEVLNLQLTVNPMMPFMIFKDRKYKIDYFKDEMRWKLSADPHNTDILDKAKMWASVINSDGTFNSNYGQYWFGQQYGLHKAFNELLKDKYSRRATIPMLRDEHLGPGVNDTVCTGHISFHIRDDALHMSVSMRSSDQVHGLGTDIPTFSFLYRMMLGMLYVAYPSLAVGDLVITADSSHIYERHFEMVQNILNNTKEVLASEADLSSCGTNSCMPLCSSREAFLLAASAGNIKPEFGPLSAWLLGVNT